MARVKTELVYTEYRDARKVLDAMKELLDHSGSVLLSDQYDLSGLPNTYMNARVGWKTLDGVSIRSEADGWNIGWIIDLPSPKPIDSESKITLRVRDVDVDKLIEAVAVLTPKDREGLTPKMKAVLSALADLMENMSNSDGTTVLSELASG